MGAALKKERLEEMVKSEYFYARLMQSVEPGRKKDDRAEYEISLINWGKLGKACLFEFFSGSLCLQR